MAKKKADPQVKKTLPGKRALPAEKDTTLDNHTEQNESGDSPKEEIPVAAKASAKKKNTNAEPAPDEKEIIKPVKKAAKKAVAKVAETSPLPDTQPSSESLPAQSTSVEVKAAKESKLLKKAAGRRPKAKPETAVKEEIAQQQLTQAEAAPEVVEHTEPVSVAESKNTAFVHKLADVSEHAHSHQEANKKSDETSLSLIVNYYTKPGQSLFVAALHPLFGNGNPDEALGMEFLDDQHWKAEVTINNKEVTEDIVYHYLLKEEDGSFVYDGGKDKKLSPSSYHADHVVIFDAWDFEGYYDNAFFTEPFKEILLKKNYTKTEVADSRPYTHTFRVKAPLLLQGQVVCLTGSSEALKSWNTEQPFLLYKNESEDYWQIRLNLPESELQVSYKYGIYDSNKTQLIQLENGENRSLHNGGPANTETIINDGFLRTADSNWKGAGVAIPVFSLRTGQSFGCGEFNDIKKLVDWAKSVDLQLIQLLPVNDTNATKTWRDSYPYSAISAFALHTMYLNADAMTSEENKHLLETYRSDAERLNELPAVDYEAVNDIKWKIIHEIYPLQKEATFASEDYKIFFEDNKHWLAPYAAFCILRDKFGTADAGKWNQYKNYSDEIVTRLSESPDEKDNTGKYYFVQYHLHLQLKDAAQYAHNNGIVMKGDITIGVARNGADSWQHPDLFNMDMQAGAPPDPFAVKGQNWSFPTYNWQRMKENGFAWWKQRFLQMSNYFDAFRIDHILGFFRIWSIPVDSVEGIMGHFVPALPVHVSEFQQWNTYFDYKRFVKPFINDSIIADLCGDQHQSVKDMFLNRDEDGTYSLKPEVSTQKRVETYFAIREPNPHNDWLKQILFDLISNVILFEEKGSDGQLFHFRFGMEKTLSYQYLDNWSKHQLYFLSLNYFYERQNDFWRKEAMQKLPALKAETDMLICGEDLGLVPPTVPGVMHELGLLSLEVQRMPKDENATFTNLERVPYLSVATPSTHDMSTIRGWWEEDKAVTQNFYNNQLGRSGEAPPYCEPDINKQVIEQHLYSPAMWSIFQLQDLLGIDGSLRRPNPNEERINVPALPNYYWRYRMHLSLEELMGKNGFTDELRGMIASSGRGAERGFRMI